MSDDWPIVPNPDDEFDEQPIEKPAKRDGRKGRNTKKNRKANSGTFGVGREPGEVRSRPPKPVPGEGFLRDLRHCLINPAYQDKTPGEKLARKLYTAKPDRFMAKLDEYEAKEQDAKKTITTGPDLGHDEAVRVLTRVLEEATKP